MFKLKKTCLKSTLVSAVLCGRKSFGVPAGTLKGVGWLRGDPLDLPLGPLGGLRLASLPPTPHGRRRGRLVWEWHLRCSRSVLDGGALSTISYVHVRWAVLHNTLSLPCFFSGWLFS
jgi:hypothetical protein